jgi:hypothetical protein
VIRVLDNEVRGVFATRLFRWLPIDREIERFPLALRHGVLLLSH